MTAIEHCQALGGALTEIHGEGRHLLLRHPIHPSIRFEEGFWSHEHPELGLLGYGESVEASLQALQDSFVMSYATYVETGERLDEGARELREMFEQLVVRADAE